MGAREPNFGIPSLWTTQTLDEKIPQIFTKFLLWFLLCCSLNSLLLHSVLYWSSLLINSKNPIFGGARTTLSEVSLSPIIIEMASSCLIPHRTLLTGALSQVASPRLLPTYRAVSSLVRGYHGTHSSSSFNVPQRSRLSQPTTRAAKPIGRSPFLERGQRRLFHDSKPRSDKEAHIRVTLQETARDREAHTAVVPPEPAGDTIGASIGTSNQAEVQNFVHILTIYNFSDRLDDFGLHGYWCCGRPLVGRQSAGSQNGCRRETGAPGEEKGRD